MCLNDGRKGDHGHLRANIYIVALIERLLPCRNVIIALCHLEHKTGSRNNKVASCLYRVTTILMFHCIMIDILFFIAEAVHDQYSLNVCGLSKSGTFPSKL